MEFNGIFKILGTDFHLMGKNNSAEEKDFHWN